MTTFAIVLAVTLVFAMLAAGTAVVGLVYVVTLAIRPSRALPKAAAGLDVPAIVGSLDGAVRTAKIRLPSDIQVKIAEIRREILELLPRTTSFPVGSEDLYVIQRTATDYLPSTLQAYLALPEGASSQVLRGGSTPEHLLREQLQLLDDRLDEITEAVHQQDSDRLLANGRFLEERFGRRLQA